MMNDTIIFGFGSDILSDERIVYLILERLESKISNVDFKCELTLSLDTLINIQEYSKIIFIDTVKSTNSCPGKVILREIKDYQPTIHLENIHDISLPQLVRVAESLDINLTKDISIISVEIVDNSTISADLSTAVANKKDHILDEAERMIKSIVAVTSLTHNVRSNS